MRRSILSQLVLAAAMCALLAPAPALAAKRPANYAVLKAGGFFPMASDVDVLDAGFNGEVAFGHYVAPGFAFEGGVGYFTMSGNATDLGFPLLDEEITVIPVTLSLKGTYPVGAFEPYAFAGIGVYFLDDEVGSLSDDDTEVGFYLGAGAAWDISPGFFVGVEGRYLFLRATTFDIERRFDGIALTANVGIRF